MLAHELHNPLAPLLNSLYVLGQDDATRRVHGQTLSRMDEVRRLNRMVEDLLEASRVVHGRVRLRPERLDLARLVRTVVEDRRPLLEQAGVALTLTAPETPVSVRATPTAGPGARQSARQRGEIRGPRRPGRHPPHDRPGRRAGGAYVSDSGIGVAPEVLGRLFDVFAQADQGLERTRGGLGLGLAVVKGLVEQHGGTVDGRQCGAGPGDGIYNPSAAGAGAAGAVAGAGSDPPSGRGAIARAGHQDNHDAAESLRMLLEILGHEVRVAFTGLEGVNQASTGARRGAIGHRAARTGRLPGGAALRREPRFENVLFVALTGLQRRG